MNIADDYIQKINDSKLRQLFMLRYLDERELAWHRVAGYYEQSIQKA